MKKIVIAALAAVALAAGIAYAHGNYGYGMFGNGNHMMAGYSAMGPGMMAGGSVFCPMASWAGGNEARYGKFLDETVDLRKQLNEAQFSYAEARRNAGTSPERLQTLEKQMLDLRASLDEKAAALL